MTQVPSSAAGRSDCGIRAGRTLDGSGYSRSPASRSNMRVRTPNGAGTPGVGQEGLTHAESARSGRPLVTVQPRQRDTRRVPPSAADRNMSASSPSRGVSGAPERRGAPSWARRRGSNSTTTADTPSPAADDPTPGPPRTARTARGTRRRAHHRLGPHTANQAEAGRRSKGASPHRRRPEPQERKAGPGRRNPPRLAIPTTRPPTTGQNPIRTAIPNLLLSPAHTPAPPRPDEPRRKTRSSRPGAAAPTPQPRPTHPPRLQMTPRPGPRGPHGPHGLFFF